MTKLSSMTCSLGGLSELCVLSGPSGDHVRTLDNRLTGIHRYSPVFWSFSRSGHLSQSSSDCCPLFLVPIHHHNQPWAAGVIYKLGLWCRGGLGLPVHWLGLHYWQCYSTLAQHYSATPPQACDWDCLFPIPRGRQGQVSDTITTRYQNITAHKGPNIG